MREKCPSFSGSCYPAFGMNTERERSISRYSVRKQGNKDQKNSKYEHFSRSVYNKRKGIKKKIKLFVYFWFVIKTDLTIRLTEDFCVIINNE